ncbi:hypothetical protein F5Y19DRAFT_485066 [Xylariaceae sp. FL1651]|nr:hypothetical protein F5Y19DRAFT_485066 [Xylariaceae sp. FL1651]
MEALWRGEMVIDLQHRIDSLPSDLAKLYADIWARANGDSERPHHQERAALYFHPAINKAFTDRLSLAIATTTGMACRIRYRNPYEPRFATSPVQLCEATMRDFLTTRWKA